jgi:hypothetical protein
VATDETENRGTVRHGDFYEGRVAVVKGSGFVNSSFKAVRKFFARQFNI